MHSFQEEKVRVSFMPLRRAVLLLGLLAAGVPVGAAVGTEQGNEALARAAQNPVASLVSVPFLNNTNYKLDRMRKPRIS